jgi:diguanylate cyclase (GGDEF)-like protein
MKEFTIIKIKMFSSSGEIIFSTDSREIGEINKRSYFHEIVAGGDTYTQLVKKDTKTLEDKIITADVVETYVPIMNNKKFIGAFELYYDISERKEALDKLVFASFVIVFIIVCVLLVAIVFSLMKAKRAITGLNLAEEQLKALSFSDELTCLHNRRGFYNLAEPLYNVAMRRNQGAFMLYADLDHLKLINDLIGHHAGDIVLKRTAEVLKDTFRGTDIIARLGGDEFAVFGVTVPGLNIEILDSRLKKNITFNNEKTDQPLTDISLSYGFAINDPQDPSSIDGLLAKADGLMYEVKKKKE